MRHCHATWLVGMFELVVIAADVQQLPTVTLQHGNQFSAVSFEMHVCPHVSKEHVHALSRVR